MKLLIITLLVLDIGIIFLFVIFMRRFVRKDHSNGNVIETMDDLLQPLLTEAKSVSYKLESLLKDKEKIVNELAEKLDQRIAKAARLTDHPSNRLFSSPVERTIKPDRLKPEKSKNFKEFQDDVIRLSQQGLSSDLIAVKLAVAKKEVDLILSLKKNIEQVRDITADMEKKETFQKLNFSERQQQSPLVKDILQKKEKKAKKPIDIPASRKSTMTFNASSNSDTLNADEVLKLSRRGVQSDAIAQKMGVSKGEVDLVLDLKKKFQSIERNLNAYK
ncbi:MAG: hypothetical protein HQK75_09195 [Candidatus Magnetomorum sp.]|nr:hypothetical protein [Candidatus Magnetomorum sp.]